MTKPNFTAMDKPELLAYLLTHRDDNEAFYALMDKAHADPAPEFYPALQSLEDVQNFPHLRQRFSQDPGKLSQE